jgi:hypothetical protein
VGWPYAREYLPRILSWLDKRQIANTQFRMSATDYNSAESAMLAYACQASEDQTLLFTANRELNHITVYDYPANEIRLRVPMPGSAHLTKDPAK